MKKELIEAGVVFETRRGRPPQKRIAFFPSVLKRWTGVKARKGERGCDGGRLLLTSSSFRVIKSRKESL